MKLYYTGLCALFAGLSFLVLFGCTGNDSRNAALGEACTANSDCNQGFCVKGICTEVEFTDGDAESSSEGDISTEFPDPEDIPIHCTEGDRTCLMDHAMECRRGMWIDPRYCEPDWKVCAGGECISPRGTMHEPAECTKNDLRCNGDMVEYCHLGRWRSHNNCPLLDMVCQNGACVYEAPRESCEPGTYHCVGTGIWYCNNGTWELYMPCEFGMCICQDGECVEYFDMCLPPTPTCYSNIRYRCRLGEIVAAADCSRNGKICAELHGCVSPEEIEPGNQCTDGETRCSIDTVTTCVRGTWVGTTDCSATGATCQNGACTPCSNGDRTCIGDTSWECVDGAWQYRQTCSLSGAVCQDGVCLAPPSRVDLPLPCQQNTTACSGPLQYTCLGSGWFLQQDCRDRNGTCQQGMCLSDYVIEHMCPGESRCGQWHTGDFMCLTPEGAAPERIPCSADRDCGDMGGLCVPETPSGDTSICLKPCGVCPDGQMCKDVDQGDNSLKACFVTSHTMPIEAPSGCTEHAQCPPSHICHCFTEDCSISACLRSCSL